MYLTILPSIHYRYMNVCRLIDLVMYHRRHHHALVASANERRDAINRSTRVFFFLKNYFLLKLLYCPVLVLDLVICSRQVRA